METLTGGQTLVGVFCFYARGLRAGDINLFRGVAGTYRDSDREVNPRGPIGNKSSNV